MYCSRNSRYFGHIKIKCTSDSKTFLQKGHDMSVNAVFDANLSLCGLSWDTPKRSLINTFLAFVCFNAVKYGDKDNEDLNVL